MKVVVAIDSLKGSLSSLQAGEAARKGIEKVYPNAHIEVCPIADGGEGTVEALALGMGGHLEKVMVTGPVGVPVECTYGIVEKESLAIIEMAGAAGITLTHKRDPYTATTYGVGEVIKDAIAKGCRRFIVGIGGSATNDGGAGMLQALGFDFLDKDGNQILRGAQGLEALCFIRTENAVAELKDCVFRVACDVTNPLCGEKGCSAVYGPQKGATPQMVEAMDGWMAHYADVVESCISKADRNHPGTGAAGGMGFAFLSFCNAVLEPGIEIVLDETRLEDYVKEADYVITGEGRLDSQTAMGKVPCGVAALAKKYGKKVIALAGCVTDDAGVVNSCGIDAFFPILRSVVSLEDAMEPKTAASNMTAAAEQVFRLIRTLE